MRKPFTLPLLLALFIVGVFVAVWSPLPDRLRRATPHHAEPTETTTDPGVSGPAAQQPTSQSSSTEGYSNMLARLQQAVASKDYRLAQALMAQMAIPSEEHERLLWDAMLAKDADYSTMLYMGSLLGKIGTATTMARAFDLLRGLSQPGTVLSYDAEGRPSPGMALLNALSSNIIRCLLQRSEYATEVSALALAYVVEPSLDPTARQSVLVTLVSCPSSDAILPELGAIFERSDDSMRSDIIAAFYSSTSPTAAVHLLDWYERYPSHRQGILIAVGASLPTATAAEILVAKAALGGDSREHALQAITLLGTHKHASSAALEVAFRSATDTPTKVAFLKAIAKTPAADRVTLLLNASTAAEEPSVRAEAYRLLVTAADPPIAFQVLAAGLATVNDKTVRAGIRGGLMILAGRGTHTEEARRALLDDLRRASGDEGRDAAAALVRYAQRAGFLPDIAESLRTTAALCNDPVVADALKHALEDARK